MAEFDGWRKILLDQIDSRITNRTRRSIGLNFPPVLQSILLRAARERGISMSAYTRRAALAFAVKDLGLDWDTVMKAEPGIVPYGAVFTDAKKHAGQNYGPWKIEGLR